MDALVDGTRALNLPPNRVAELQLPLIGIGADQLLQIGVIIEHGDNLAQLLQDRVTDSEIRLRQFFIQALY